MLPFTSQARQKFLIHTAGIRQGVGKEGGAAQRPHRRRCLRRYVGWCRSSTSATRGQEPVEDGRGRGRRCSGEAGTALAAPLAWRRALLSCPDSPSPNIQQLFPLRYGRTRAGRVATSPCTSVRRTTTMSWGTIGVPGTARRTDSRRAGVPCLPQPVVGQGFGGVAERPIAAVL